MLEARSVMQDTCDKQKGRMANKNCYGKDKGCGTRSNGLCRGESKRADQDATKKHQHRQRESKKIHEDAYGLFCFVLFCLLLFKVDMQEKCRMQRSKNMHACKNAREQERMK